MDIYKVILVNEPWAPRWWVVNTEMRKVYSTFPWEEEDRAVDLVKLLNAMNQRKYGQYNTK